MKSLRDDTGGDLRNVGGNSARPIVPLGRRQVLGLLAWGVLGTAAAQQAGAQGFTLTRDQLNALLASSFPYTQNLSGLANLRLESPRLGFLPASNRLSTALDFVLSELLTGQSVSGAMDLDYGLRFDPTEGAVRLADVRLDRLNVDRLPPQEQQLVSMYAPQAAQALLSGLVLYRVPQAQMTLMRDLGVTVKDLRVLPDGVRAELGPRGL